MKDLNDNCFTGKISIKLNEKTNIGYINAGIKCIMSEPINNIDAFSFKKSKSQTITFQDNELQNEWPHLYYSYTKIKNDLLERFFKSKEDVELHGKLIKI